MLANRFVYVFFAMHPWLVAVSCASKGNVYF